MAVTTRLLGDLEGALNKLETRVRESVLISGAAAAAKVFYDEARSNAERNKKTGKLHDAIYRVYAEDKSSDTTKVYQISWNRSKAPHGHLIEFGTSRAPAYPFIRPAFDRANDAIEAGKRRMAERMKELA
jgi:HK97 gp10 family phage protein